jgi:hypothetical protein
MAEAGERAVSKINVSALVSIIPEILPANPVGKAIAPRPPEPMDDR